MLRSRYLISISNEYLCFHLIASFIFYPSVYQKLKDHNWYVEAKREKGYLIDVFNRQISVQVFFYQY